MEWTAENAGTPGPGPEQISELGTPPKRRRHPARTVAASLTAVALLAAAVGIVATRGGGSSRPPLVLTPGAAAGKEAPAGLDDGNGSSPYRFRLAITAPDLGSDAPVARLVAPAVDAARVRALADILALDGSVTATASGGWQVLDQTSVLSVEPTPGGWAFSYGLDAGVSAPGSVPGSDGSSDGSGVSSDPDGADGSGNSGSVDPSTGTEPQIGEPPPTVEPVAPPTIPLPPKHLPDAAGAERIARALLERLGVAEDSWSATVPDTNGDDGVACAPEPCALSKTVATQRTVVLSPMFDSIAVSGISWQVQIGDNGTVLGVYGTWTTLRTLDRYPLRPVLSVFADLVAGKGTSRDARAADRGRDRRRRSRPRDRADPGVDQPHHARPRGDARVRRRCRGRRPRYRPTCSPERPMAVARWCRNWSPSRRPWHRR